MYPKHKCVWMKVYFGKFRKNKAELLANDVIINCTFSKEFYRKNVKNTYSNELFNNKGCQFSCQLLYHNLLISSKSASI